MKKLTKSKKRWIQAGVVLLSFICFGGLGSCVESGSEVTVPTYYPSDPNKAVTFSDFTPSEGAVRTRMFIRGSNFGTDASLISVTIGGKKAKVISSTDVEIYCMVPARASEGRVQVEIKNADGSEGVKHTFEQMFTYHFNTMVGTLCGNVDAEGNTSIKDGTFEEAQFVNPRLMLFDDIERNIYLFEGNTSVRKVDLDAQTVSTVLKTGDVNWKEANSMAWSVDKDTMFINNNTSNENDTGIYYFLRKEGFQIAHNCLIGDGINCVFTHPTEVGMLFYVRKEDSGLYKAVFNPETQLWDGVFQGAFSRPGQLVHNAVFHPSGKFVYCLARENKNIQKAEYNAVTKTLEYPNVFVGDFNAGGYWDGPGLEARFQLPLQGCFVENEEYKQAGREDIYDFYVVDGNNHCVRIVSPTGLVDTYAGRGSVTTDGKVNGYIDGDLRKEARFNTPMGICFDTSNVTFYMTDKNNHRIRTISVQ